MWSQARGWLTSFSAVDYSSVHGSMLVEEIQQRWMNWAREGIAAWLHGRLAGSEVRITALLLIVDAATYAYIMLIVNVVTHDIRHLVY